MGTARMKQDKETEDEGKSGVCMKRTDCLSIPNQTTIIINIINTVLFYKIWKKDNEIQLRKNKIDLNNGKMKNHPPSIIQRHRNILM